MMPKPTQYPIQMALEHSRHFLHRLQPAADRPLVPLLEELSGVARIPIIPEPAKLLPDRPCPRRFQFLLLERLKDQPFLFTQVLGVEEPKLLGARERLVSFFPTKECGS